MEIDLKENPWLTTLAFALLIALVLVALAFLGRNVTPVEPRVLQWNDWQILQARREHNKEIAILRADLNDIAVMFQQPPDPIAAQILSARIAQHTRSGQPTLEAARVHLQNAADGLVTWSGLQMERDEMIALIQSAEGALK